MSMNGIDISNWQAGLDLTQVPCDFVILKATEGLGFIDGYCDGWFQQAKALGKKIGVYHFASGDSSGRAEADFFYEHIKNYVGEALLILDWEASAVHSGVGYALEFLNRLYELTGVRGMLYSYNNCINSYDWSSVASAGYGLWNAGYYAGYEVMGYNPSAPLIGGTGAWNGAAMYQYTSSGRLPGWDGNLDLDVFYGDASAWDAYCKGNETVVSHTTAQSTPQTGQIIYTEPVQFTYAVRTGGRVLPEVVNLSDYAGVHGSPITDIAIKCSYGSVKYQVHVKGGDWLPYVTGYDWSDHENGYAGCGQEIDAVRVYYYTPSGARTQKAQYRVSPVDGGYYDWQYDDEVLAGQDGYAGAFGKAIDRFQLF